MVFFLSFLLSSVTWHPRVFVAPGTLGANWLQWRQQQEQQQWQLLHIWVRAMRGRAVPQWLRKAPAFCSSSSSVVFVSPFTEFCSYLISWWSGFLPQAEGSSTYILSFADFLSSFFWKAHTLPSTRKALTSDLITQSPSLAHRNYDTRSKCLCILVFTSCNTEMLVLI